MSRTRVLSDAEWALIAPLLPSNVGRRGHPFGHDRRVVDGIIYRFRTSTPWRDVPRGEFGPSLRQQTVARFLDGVLKLLLERDLVEAGHDRRPDG